MTPPDRKPPNFLDPAGRGTKNPPPPTPMNILLLKVLHLAAAMALFSSLGAIMLGETRKKGASMLHGISLILVLLIGFAMLQKPPAGQYWWVAKIAVWLFIGAAPALSKRKVLPGPVVLGLCIAAGATAAWLGIYKPF
ncbi:MAG: hypothetical protein V4584_01050 [Verrucomicrobiota bacterium]